MQDFICPPREAWQHYIDQLRSQVEYLPVEEEEEGKGGGEKGDQELTNLSKVEKLTKAVGKVGSAAPKVVEAASKVAEMV